MTELPKIRKFMFNTTFDVGADAAQRPPERKPVMLKPEQVDAMKKESFDEGLATGMKSAADSHATHIAALLGQIDKRIEGLANNLQSLHQQQIKTAHDIALSIARKLMPDLTTKNGLQEISAMISAAITEMVHEPRLVVRIHESEFDSINAKVQDIVAQKAYAGKVVVLADAEVAAGDCRVEWADGGMERNTAQTLASIEKIVTPADSQAAQPEQQ